jgi:hypothetical protein
MLTSRPQLFKRITKSQSLKLLRKNQLPSLVLMKTIRASRRLTKSPQLRSTYGEIRSNHGGRVKDSSKPSRDGSQSASRATPHSEPPLPMLLSRLMMIKKLRLQLLSC